LRRGAFFGYRWALLAFLLAGAAQISLAGLGVLSLHDQGIAGYLNARARRREAYGPSWQLSRRPRPPTPPWGKDAATAAGRPAPDPAARR
jgi:hypothetical protein